ncbi:hypothetical protein [Allochromatium tepidum]|uniref:hypothetical protein n=1 Tax=Allochromatium tepidum TaxID=553982 RepID=UPI001BCD4C71|nr:hypothetical protein [Allochromatium tepidum]
MDSPSLEWGIVVSGVSTANTRNCRHRADGLLDPAKRTLEVYALPDGAWQLELRAGGADVVQAPPFVELTLELESLWV